MLSVTVEENRKWIGKRPASVAAAAAAAAAALSAQPMLVFDGRQNEETNIQKKIKNTENW